MRKGQVLAGCLIVLLLSYACSVRNDPPGAVAQALSQRVAGLMENNFADVYAPDHTGTFRCAAHTFGMDPSTAKRAVDVDEVYAWVYCEETRPDGLPGDQVSAPVAIRLTTPPTLQLPVGGEGHAKSVARIFPASLQGIATHQPAYVDDLVRQVHGLAHQAIQN